MLLLNYPIWFYGEDAQYPYAVAKQLRERKQRNAGKPFTLPDIADEVTTLSDPQIRRLEKEFPQIDAARTVRPLVVLYKKYPGILSKAGVPTDATMITTLTEGKRMPALADKDTLEKLRILEEAPSADNGGKRLYRAQYQTAQKKEWQELTTLTLVPDAPVPH